MCSRISIILLLCLTMIGCKDNTLVPWGTYIATYKNGASVQVVAKAFKIEKTRIYFYDNAYIICGWRDCLVPQVIATYPAKQLISVVRVSKK